MDKTNYTTERRKGQHLTSEERHIMPFCKSLTNPSASEPSLTEHISTAGFKSR